VEFRLKVFGYFVEGWLKGYMDKDIRIEGLVNCLDWHGWRGIIFGIWIYG